MDQDEAAAPVLHIADTFSTETRARRVVPHRHASETNGDRTLAPTSPRSRKCYHVVLPLGNTVFFLPSHSAEKKMTRVVTWTHALRSFETSSCSRSTSRMASLSMVEYLQCTGRVMTGDLSLQSLMATPPLKAEQSRAPFTQYRNECFTDATESEANTHSSQTISRHGSNDLIMETQVYRHSPDAQKYRRLQKPDHEHRKSCLR